MILTLTYKLNNKVFILEEKLRKQLSKATFYERNKLI